MSLSLNLDGTVRVGVSVQLIAFAEDQWLESEGLSNHLIYRMGYRPGAADPPFLA